MTGCFSLRSLTLKTIPSEREFIVVHAGERYWIAENLPVADDTLTARIISMPVKIRKGNSVHLWVAPPGAVMVNDSVISIPASNVGKVDYSEINVAATTTFSAVWALVLYTLTAIIFS
jgi:hypothetical protein